MQPKNQLKGPVKALIQLTRARVITKIEVQVRDLGGTPEFNVEVSGVLCGHVELNHFYTIKSGKPANRNPVDDFDLIKEQGLDESTPIVHKVPCLGKK